MTVVLIVSIVVALVVGFFVGTRLAATRRRARRATVQNADATLLAEARAELRATTDRLTATEKALDAAEAQLSGASAASEQTGADEAGASDADETGSDETGSDEAGFDEAGFDEAGSDEAGMSDDVPGSDEPGSDPPAAATEEAVTTPGEAGTDALPRPGVVEPGFGEAGAGAGSDGRSGRVLDAVWQLQRLEMAGQRRREAQLSTAVDETDGTLGLVHALQQEIERVREEIGTPGDFTSDLPIEPEAAVALLVQRSTHLMLDVLARQSQAFDLHLTGGNGTLAVTMLCESFEGSVPDADRIAEAIGGAGGTLEMDRDAEERFRARLTVPTSEAPPR